MMSSNRYQRIGDDDTIPENATEMTVMAVPSAPTEQTNPLNPHEASNLFAVKVLLKEKAFEISGLSNDTRIGDFKSAIEAATSVPSAHQRLIFSGKQLKPDTKTFSDFKITSGSSIHLFPLPVAPPTVPVANAVEASGTAYNPLTVQGVSAAYTAAAEELHRPIHFDPYINQTSREVKLWCLILMFLSGMTLFNNLSFVSSTGRLGQGVLDSIVTVLDTLVSALGLVVGNMGMQSVRTMELEDVNKYVKCLIALASMAICMRLLWVADVILQVQKLVRDQDDTGNDGKDPGPPTVEDDAVQTRKLDGKTVVTFGIQASIIALICIFAWGSCVWRARRLQTAVAEYNNAHQV